MNIFSLFSGQQGQQGQQNQGQPNQQQNNQDPKNQAGNPGGNNPGPNQNSGNGTNNQTNGTNNQQLDPMDAYAKLFDNANTNQEAAPSFNLDDKTLDQVATNLDFTTGIDPELMQKATGGDVQALIQLMQQTQRNTYKTLMKHNSVLTDKFVGARESHNEKALGSKVRNELTVNELAGAPNYKHPVVRKQLTEIAQKMQAANPDASPQEIATAARQYITDLYKAMNPEDSSSKPNQQDGGPVNWDSYFGEEASN